MRADLPALTKNEAAVLAAVKSCPPPAGAGKLAKRAGTTANAAKASLDRLIGKGYVRKIAHGHYLLTDAAVALLLPKQPPA